MSTNKTDWNEHAYSIVGFVTVLMLLGLTCVSMMMTNHNATQQQVRTIHVGGPHEAEELYAQAFWANDTIMIHMPEAQAGGPWRVTYTLISNGRGLGLGSGTDCILDTYMTTCAIVAPPNNQRLDIFVYRDAERPAAFSGHLLVRRGSAPPVEWRPDYYEANTGATVMRPVPR